jgi:hypothetical protein
MGDYHINIFYSDEVGKGRPPNSPLRGARK